MALARGSAVLIVVAVTVPVAVTAVAIGLILRRRLARSVGVDALREAARGLTRRERWQVYRAVGRGRAVADVRLAPAAVARSRYVRGVITRFRTRGWRRIQVALGVIMVASIPLGVIHLNTWKHKALAWFLIAIRAYLALFFVFVIPRIYVRAERRATEAEEANLALMGQHQA